MLMTILEVLFWIAAGIVGVLFAMYMFVYYAGTWLLKDKIKKRQEQEEINQSEG